MSVHTLDDLITDQGTKSTYFFNGRLLSGEDLRQEQDANRQARRVLAQTIGTGVATGFEVTQKPANLTSATLTIASGLALNRLGQTIRLNVSVDVALTPPATQTAGTASTAFRDCTQPANAVYILDSGIYLLAVCPVAARQGRAPVSGLGNQVSACNTNYTVDGVQFLLVSIAAADLPVLNAAKSRNLVAYRCFGIGEWSDVPYGTPPAQIGLVDRLRANGQLHDCDVPLAVFSWTSTVIQDLDMWSVRRRITTPWPDDTSGSQLSDLRRSMSEAMILQFRSHLADLLSSSSAASAAQAFRYLPPAGYLPLGNAIGKASASSTRPPSGGVDWRAFLGGLTDGRLTRMNHGLLREILHQALDADPIDLNQPQPSPVCVYAHDDSDSFVLFARTRDGRAQISFASGPPQDAVVKLVPKYPAGVLGVPVTPSVANYSVDAAPGAYNITVTSTNFLDYQSDDLIVTGGEFVKAPVITLIPVVTTGSIFVSLLKLNALTNFRVSATSGGVTHPAVLSAPGKYLIAKLPPGVYQVKTIGALKFGDKQDVNLAVDGVKVTAGVETLVEPDF
jgi:hypothetical protein